MQTLPFIPENAPFDAGQRLWLNGYMAGLIAGKGYAPIANSPASDNRSVATVPLLILFGSQTGTAEKLARQLARDSKARAFAPRVLEAAQFTTIDWTKETNLVVVTSTHGDGDMPDNAQAFWDWLQTDGANSLKRLNFSVLALGDTNYEHFCAAGKKIDARLEEIGAKRFHPLVECDLDYEARAKSWNEGILAALAPSGKAVPRILESMGTRHPAANEGFSKSNPFPARLLANRLLNADGSEKETRHFELSLEGSKLNYEAGDALGIYPSNCSALVDDLLVALGWKGDEMVIATSGEMTLQNALTHSFDITKPSRELLQRLAQQNSALCDLLLPDRNDALKNWLRGREIIDLLHETPSVRFSPSDFVSFLKKLAPRLYSIASSPKAYPEQVHLTISVVRHNSHGRMRKGVASTFLADRVSAEVNIPVFVQASHGFRLPSDGKTPVVMVGPGTGVAPFRAFLHERRAIGASGRNWLFFGEQRAATDFYYRDELEKNVAEGHLTKLCTAFSRDQEQKVYVQHRMLEHATELWSWLQDGAHLYVCGDASRMAKDVDEALHRIIEVAGGKTPEEAKGYVANLRAEKRYQRDVY